MKIFKFSLLFFLSIGVLASNNPIMPIAGGDGISNDNANTETRTAPMNFPADLAWQHLYDISPSGIASFTLNSGTTAKFSVVDGDEGVESFAVTNDTGVSVKQGFNLESETGNIFSGNFNTTDSNIVYAAVCLSPFNCASAPFPALSTHSGLSVLTYAGGGIFNTTTHAFDIWDGGTWRYLLFTNHINGSGGTTVTDNGDGTVTVNSLAAANIVQTSGNQTINGTKTFSSPISGDISGNSGTTTNGVVTTGSYVDPAWITSLAGSKISGAVANATLASTVTTNANLTGDVTSIGNASTLATVNSNVGSFGSATQTGTFTVNAKGLITAASNVTISGVAPGGSATGDLSGSYPNPTVAKINNVTLGTTTATSGNILIGSGTQWVTNPITGNVTLSAAGVTTIGASQVTNAMLAGSIDLTSKVTGDLPFSNGGFGFHTATTGDIFYASGTNTPAKLADIATGAILTSGGVGASPTYSNTLSSAVLGNIAKTTTTILTSGSGTYNSPANCTHVVEEIWGGGGGGGGVAGASSSAGGASGGGGGGYVKATVSCPVSVAYSIGAAGAGGSLGANAGTDGGDTTFSTMTASGGGGGAATTAGVSAVILQSGSGGAASGGDLNITGGSGGQGLTLSSTICTGGFGGASSRGGPGIKSPLNGNGLGGLSPGGGGSGAATVGLNSRSGGNAAAGRAIITEYYNG